MDKIKFMLSSIWVFLLPFIKILMSRSGQILAEAAMKAVQTMANRDLDNSQKRDAAYKMIVLDLKNSGLGMATSVVNAALEAAVIRMKAKD